MRRLTFCLLGWLWAAAAFGAPPQIRVATYNASLNRTAAGTLASDLSTGSNAQAKKVAEILQRVRPDIVLVNEFDYDAAGLSRDRFHNNYLAVSQNGQAPLTYAYSFIAPSNTGIHSGFDFDNDNVISPTQGTDVYGNDCYGFGWFPGQYGFVVYSRFPIRASDIRSFQLFLWKSMPGAVLPDRVATPTVNDWYSASEQNVFRLSSKNHCDIPIEVVPGQILHLLASHPTPPSFDGSEDRNGRRNYDEIRLWADYISNATYLKDDAGTSGGLAADQRFVILGDMNADPLDGDSFLNPATNLKAINQLLTHSLINTSVIPTSLGGPQQSALQGGVNSSHKADPKYDTADFSDVSSGNLRVDHVLPSKSGLGPVSGGVFWPLTTEPGYSLISASDHRLVWMDLTVVPIPGEAVRNLAVLKQGAGVVLQWQALAGVSYTVQTSADLLIWNAAPQITVSVDANLNGGAVDAGASTSARVFYRVVVSL